MKYIKLLEDFNTGYTRVLPRDFNARFLNSKLVFFTKEEIQTIEKLYEDHGIKCNFESESGASRIGSWLPHKDVKSLKKYLRMEKFDDEWFLVTDYPFYYACDQMEGLISLLKSLMPEKNTHI